MSTSDKDQNMFKKGQKVRILPHTDQFMMGELYGRVTSVKRRKNPEGLFYTRVYVRGELSGKRFNMHPSWIEAIEGGTIE